MLMRNLYSDMMKSISYEKLLPDIYSLYICLIALWSILFCIIKIYFEDEIFCIVYILWWFDEEIFYYIFIS